MKLLKLSLAAAVAALVIGTGTVARATPIYVADGIYAFTATDGMNAKNGSTVTFLNDVIVNWNLVDSAPAAAGFVPLNPGNSSIISSQALGPDAWYFTIGSPIGTPSADASTFWFEGQNNLFGDLGGGSVGSLYDKSGDPIGTWGPARTPDAASTFQLLAGALTALGTCKAFLRGRAASRR